MNIHVKQEVISVDPATVLEWLNQDQVVLVDVRETSEFDQEHIPGALLQPMSVFDPELFPSVPGKKVVLHCAVGKRSEAAGKMLLTEGHQNVIHMAGGLHAWKEAGFETEAEYVPPAVDEDEADLAADLVNGQADAAGSALADAITAPLPGEVLVDEFMAPLDLSTAELATAISVTPQEIESIIDGSAPITAELSLRLARYFCTETDFWINLQVIFDVERASLAVGSQIVHEISPRLCA